MPIRVQDELPAVNFLRNENVFVMTTTRATTQEIRPLKVCFLNLIFRLDFLRHQVEENRDGKPVPASAIKLSAAGGYPVITYRCARVA